MYTRVIICKYNVSRVCLYFSICRQPGSPATRQVLGKNFAMCPVHYEISCNILLCLKNVSDNFWSKTGHFFLWDIYTLLLSVDQITKITKKEVMNKKVLFRNEISEATKVPVVAELFNIKRKKNKHKILFTKI